MRKLLLIILVSLAFWKNKSSLSDTSPLNKISPGSIEAGYELTEVNSLGLTGFGISLILGAVVMHLSLGTYFFWLRHHESQAKIHHEQPPEPQLQTDPSGDLKKYLDRESRLLRTYGWVNPHARIARIPIERAMTLMAGASHE